MQLYDGATLEELQSLNTALQVHLNQAISLLGDVGAELQSASTGLNAAFQETSNGLTALQIAYVYSNYNYTYLEGHTVFP